MSMDYLSAKQKTQSPSEVYPKVSLSSSSGSSSFRIRAPLTIDSTESSDSGFESEGFLSGGDDFESASERPFVADPDDEILEESIAGEELIISTHFEVDSDEESSHVEEYIVSRPFVQNMDDEFLSNNADKFSVSRPFVADTGTPMTEADECGVGVEPEVMNTRILPLPKPGMPPIAQLSGDSDEDPVGSEVEEDDGFSGPVRVPATGILEKLDYEVLEVEEGEADESQFEAVLECKVVEDSISNEVLNGVLGFSELKVNKEDSVEDSISAGMVQDEGHDAAEETKSLSLVANKDSLQSDSSELDEDAESLFEKVQAPENMEQVSELQERNSMYLGSNAALDVPSKGQGEMVINSVQDKEAVEGVQGLVTDIDEGSCEIICPVDSMPLEADKDTLDADKMGSEANDVRRDEGDGVQGVRSGIDERSFDINFGVDSMPFGADKATLHDEMGSETNDVRNIDEDGVPNTTGVEIFYRSADVAMKSHLTNCAGEDTTEVDKNFNLDTVLVDNQECQKNDADINESIILSQGSENENPENIIKQETDSGCDHSPKTSESIILEPVSVSSKSNHSLDVYRNDEEDSDLIRFEEKKGLLSDTRVDEDLSIGELDTVKNIVNELDQAFPSASVSVAENSQYHSQGFDGKIIAESDKEVDTNGESEGRELFDSAALVALLRAATGAEPEGGSVALTSADGSKIFSLERAAGLSSTARSVKAHSQPNLTSTKLLSKEIISEEEKKLERMQQIRVKFLRLVQRLGRSADDPIAAQVLYRLDLAAGWHSSLGVSLESAKRTAMEVEADGKSDLDFCLNILIIGKSGVGKSATINSIFGEEKAMIDPFEPATTTVKEILGTVDGIKVRLFDTPGFRYSLKDQSLNQKILKSIKKFMKRSPPDVVLYVDRIDTLTRDFNDLPLLRSITSFLGPSVWGKSIVTLTHAASTTPDGPSGSALSYEVYVAQQSLVAQQLIRQAVGDIHMVNADLTSPVCLVENHPSCKKDENGQFLLPNGKSWKPQLLLLCYSLKILSEANSIVKAQVPPDHMFDYSVRSPMLPFFLSSLLQSYTHPKLSTDQGGENIDSDIELGCSFDYDQEDEDEYAQLPPFKPLRKSQIAKLSKEQRKAYFDEFDFRVKLLQKKQWMEDMKRFQEFKKKGKEVLNDSGYMEEKQETGGQATAVPLPDMVLPPSFDGDNPGYRYRFLEPTSQLISRPILDLHCWDHDCGYDGVNFEQSLAIAGHFPAAIAAQITKDKNKLSIHMDSSVAAKHWENGSTMAGFDIQTVGKQLAYILKGETKTKHFKIYKTAAGLSITFLGEHVISGLKLENQIAVGKQLVLVGSTGATRSKGNAAYGANLEVRIREKDYPVEQEDQTTLALSFIQWRGDLIWGCNLQSQFSIGRNSKMSLHAGLNNKLSGQISLRTSSSDQLHISLVGLLPIACTILRNFFPSLSDKCPSY